jgi:hypothetical protein
MVPDISLSFNVKVRSRVRFPNVDGIIPVNLLLYKLNDVIWLRLPNVDGIVPVN